MSKHKTEFDSYAHGYTGGIEHPLKRMTGENAAAFLIPKAKWLVSKLTRLARENKTDLAVMKLLDYGCGTGEFLQVLRKAGFTASMVGCDVSSKMLAIAAQRWNDGPLPQLRIIPENAKTPFQDSTFDIIVACCVFHHITPSRHRAVLCELARILKQDGCLVIFEHNPLNLITQWVVRSTVIDRNTTLISARTMQSLMQLAGLTTLGLDYLLFFPPRLRYRLLGIIERLLWWVPFGGQYALLGRRNAHAL